jgi:ferredoxin
MSQTTLEPTSEPGPQEQPATSRPRRASTTTALGIPTVGTPTPAAVRPGAPTPGRGRNLMNLRPVAWLMRSRLYPTVFQAAVAAAFVLVGYQLLAGPEKAHDNLGTALMWVLWWPLIPIIFLAMGRVWCAVCPFGTLNDLVQRAVGVQMAPPAVLKKYGIWIIDILFLAITWADHVFGVVESPWGSGVLLLLLTTAVIASGALFQRRTFCRYLCPIGGMSGNYARTGAITLRADTSICATCTSKAACFNGGDKAPECPLWQFPPTMDTGANCNLCARCIKNCPNDAIELQVGTPTRELWFIRKPKVEESFLAMAIMGIVLVQNMTMLKVWAEATDAIKAATGITSPAVLFTAVFVVAVAFPVASLALAAKVAANAGGGTVTLWFARFGYAMIPLDIAGHIAHNLFHLLAEGKAVWFTAMPLFGRTAGDGSAALVSTGTIQALQYLVVALGTAASLYTAKRIAQAHTGTRPWTRTVVPFAAVIIMFAVINIGLFAMPMAHRM